MSGLAWPRRLKSMTQGRSRIGGRLSGARLSGARLSGYQVARCALAALLIVLAAAELRGGLPPLRLDGPYVHDELPIAAVLEAIVAGLLIVVAVRRARASRDHFLAVRLREVLRSVLIAAVFAVPLCYLLTRTVRISARPSPVRLPSIPGSPGRFHIPPGSGHAFSFAGTATDLVLAGVLLAAIAGCWILLLRRRWSRRASSPPPGAESADDDGAAELRRALEYGWIALRELDDARGAIIACYLAMELSLAKTGTARGVAETPDELLARAASAGVIRGTAAARLTSVFYEARFSTRELTTAHRDTAEQALTELAESLSEAAR
jgi:hypothetical protein